MKIWFDTEFIEDGKTIDLLSIGMVTEAGDKLYMENADCDRALASDWVKDNVIPHLHGPLFPRDQIARAVKSFSGGSPEFWAYYADYDWVVLCQMFGTMMDLPSGWPMYCRDLKQLIDDRYPQGHPKPPSPVINHQEHNALADAIWTKGTYDWVME
jgi:hypothetical protein